MVQCRSVDNPISCLMELSPIPCTYLVVYFFDILAEYKQLRNVGGIAGTHGLLVRFVHMALRHGVRGGLRHSVLPFNSPTEREVHAFCTRAGFHPVIFKDEIFMVTLKSPSSYSLSCPSSSSWQLALMYDGCIAIITVTAVQWVAVVIRPSLGSFVLIHPFLAGAHAAAKEGFFGLSTPPKSYLVSCSDR